MFVLKTLLAAAVLVCVQSQGLNGPTTTPVPILKQINRQNDDGSYSYGYEAADGSFKIETKYPNGDVAGKYGYIDETGKTREISYGASSQRGFEPQGTGINVPPPTLNDHSNNALTDGQEDDGQYREDPKIYEDPKFNSRNQGGKGPVFKQYHRPSEPVTPAPRYQPEPQYVSEPQYQPEPQYQTQYTTPQPRLQSFQNSQFRAGPLFSQETSLFQDPQQYRQEYKPQSQIYHQQPQFSYQGYTPQPYNQYQNQYQPQNYQNQDFNQFSGHPAQNFDPNTGSYTINFTG